MDIHSLIKRATANAESKGWHDDYRALKAILAMEGHMDEFFVFKNYYRTAKLMLVVGELSEAVEAIRKGDIQNHAEELADVMIRMFDYCGEFGIDLEAAIQAKMLVNERRPYKHDKAL